MAITILSEPAAISSLDHPIVFKIQMDNYQEPDSDHSEDTNKAAGVFLDLQVQLFFIKHGGTDFEKIHTNTLAHQNGLASIDIQPMLLEYLQNNAQSIRPRTQGEYYCLFRGISKDALKTVKASAQSDTKQVIKNMPYLMQELEVLSFSGNPITLKLHSASYLTETENFKFRVKVFLKSADSSVFKDINSEIINQNIPSSSVFRTIYSEVINQNTPFSGSASIDISKILDAYIDYPLPFFESTRIRKQTVYYCRIAEKYDTKPKLSPIYFQTKACSLIKGGLSHIGFKTKKLLDLIQPDPSDFSKNRFLKQGRRTINMREDQPEWLTYVNTLPNNTSFMLKMHVNYVNETSEVGSLTVATLKQYDKIEIYCGLATLRSITNNDSNPIKSYDVYLCKDDDRIVSEKITYLMDDHRRENVRYFIYQSSFGTIETLVTYGQGTQEYELSSQSIQKPKNFNYELLNSTRVNYNMRLQRTFTASTGWLEKVDFDRLAEFFLSEKKWIMKSGIPLPITVTSKKAGEFHDRKALISQMFEYRYDFDDAKYTDGDA